MRRVFKKGDRIRIGRMDRTGTVLDEVTDDWLGESFQILDIQMDGVDGTPVRIPDTNVHHFDEEKA